MSQQTSRSTADDSPDRRTLANAIRALSMDAVQAANSGHPGMPMGMADIAEVLWNDYLKHNPGNPDDQRRRSQRDRDRLLYSAAFRRLAGVTQVASPAEVDVFHNRLTHTLKVATHTVLFADGGSQVGECRPQALCIDFDRNQTAG